MNKHLDESLENLEKMIRHLRSHLKSQELEVGFIGQLRLQIESLLSIFSALEADHELAQAHQVLLIVAKFINQELDYQRNSFETCFLATCSLCGETDPRITQIAGKLPQPEQVERVLAVAKEHILMIKVHYESLSEASNCKCETEIFSIKTGANKPRVKRIEEEIPWEALTTDIRDSFLREGKQKISYQVYPIEE
ncbi:hypothetical protein [Rivularia sp. UHCC 0363]|uniref:hypothetical protein n=1 Tax=Rivularia sp. UHCC 0363 TaxID=3110244 RepID=UPI002B211D5E|nr:hypothetical protein [Rivularia sp. UHCC 0363]MEA5599295.1 hypothetical protein [Rivularia sp. UHCC 0363]